MRSRRPRTSCSAWRAARASRSRLRFPSRSLRLLMQKLAAASGIDDQRLEVGLRAALRRAVLRRDAHELARFAQRHAAALRREAQAAFERLLLQASQYASVTARCDLGAPLERAGFQLPGVH